MKKGQEGIGGWPVIIAIIILIVVAIFIIYSFLVKHREEGSIFTRLFNQTTGTDGISLRGTSGDVKKNPEHYLDDILRNDPQRYIDICKNSKDPKGSISNDDINLLKKEDCNDVKIAEDNLAKKQTGDEEKADGLYKQYKTNLDTGTLEKLRKEYPNSDARRFAEILNSDKFDQEAVKLCSGANKIVILLYCADLYETRADKISSTDSNKAGAYRRDSSGYYTRATNIQIKDTVNEREKRFLAYSYYWFARLLAKTTNTKKEYLSKYRDMRTKFDDNYKDYLYHEDIKDFEMNVMEETKSGMKAGSFELYPLVVAETDKGIKSSPISRTALKKGYSGITVYVDFEDANGVTALVTVLFRPIPLTELSEIVPPYCEFKMQGSTSGSGILVENSPDYCKDFGISFVWREQKDLVSYAIIWK
ncbi:hypothetical protein HYV88_04595 [Candidatus Woesearchaeota archaeon]|nr:hypothetical protein [Candidatus Woesearchaeota archaeon]